VAITTLLPSRGIKQISSKKLWLISSGESTHFEINKGHGRIEKRTVSICQKPLLIREWPGLQMLIRVESERQLTKGGLTIVIHEIRYYIASIIATAGEFARRIRGYWGVENKVHYVRDVTQGEDSSRIRTTPLPQIFAVARNFALNLYRDRLFENMAQAQRLCSFGLYTLKQLFRMK
jgi:predicted transposase YbfD/YdcC